MELAKLEKIKEKVKVSVIGEMLEKKKGVFLMERSGKRRKLKRTGFTHF